ncbi:MAG TPA: SCO family protein [Ktedonosporobacter sp.]|nr:SCO family protein [Ktedonosporobacter sp.]
MRHPDSMRKLALAAFIATSALVVMAGTAWGIRLFALHRTQAPIQQPANMAIGGFPMNGKLAPDFNLVDQFSQPMTLSSLRGHEVVLAFIDSQCKSLCPLTATIMYNAKAQLGPSAANKVVLIAVNANPTATSVAEVQAWSISHGMLHQWSFLTGTAQQLQSVYHSYNELVQVSSSGLVVHDSAMLIIDPTGHERLYFETLDSSNQTDLKSEESGLVAGMRQWLPS